MSTPVSPPPRDLQYCPVCHQLIRPSLFQSGEAVMNQGVGYHVACLQKRPPTPGAGRSVAAAAEPEKKTATSIAASIQRPSGRRESAANHSHGHTHGHGREGGSARRSDPHLRHHANNASKGSPAAIIFVALLVLAGAAAALLILINHNTSPDIADSDSTSRTSSTPRQPPGNSSPTPTQAAPPGGGNSQTGAGSTGTPAVPPTAPEPKELSPYELSKLNKPATPAPVSAPVNNPMPAPAPADGDYEPAGPTQTWEPGEDLGDWKIIRANNGAVQVKDHVIEIDPGDSPAYIEHALPAADYDLSYEFRLGPQDQGAWTELWMPAGIVQMDAGRFQSSNFTLVKVKVRGGVLSATCGEKGNGNQNPAGLKLEAPEGLRAELMAGRQVMIYSMSSTDTKSIRNVQFTPYRRKAVAAPAPAPAPAPVPTPVPVPDNANAAHMLTQPVTLLADKLDQPQGRWERATVATEGGKGYVIWSSADQQERTLDFQFTLANTLLPKAIRLHLVYRLRNVTPRNVSVKFWGQDGNFATKEFAASVNEAWQSVDLDFDDVAQAVGQIEIRTRLEAGEQAQLEISSLRLSAR